MIANFSICCLLLFLAHSRYYRCVFCSRYKARASFILVGYLVFISVSCYVILKRKSCVFPFVRWILRILLWYVQILSCIYFLYMNTNQMHLLQVQMRELTLGYSYLCYFVHICILITSSLLTACHIVAYESFHYVWIHSPGVHWWTAVNRVRLICAIFIIICATTWDSEV